MKSRGAVNGLQLVEKELPPSDAGDPPVNSNDPPPPPPPPLSCLQQQHHPAVFTDEEVEDQDGNRCQWQPKFDIIL